MYDEAEPCSEDRQPDQPRGPCHIRDLLEELLAQYPVRLPESELQAIEDPVAV